MADARSCLSLDHDAHPSVPRWMQCSPSVAIESEAERQVLTAAIIVAPLDLYSFASTACFNHCLSH